MYLEIIMKEKTKNIGVKKWIILIKNNNYHQKMMKVKINIIFTKKQSFYMVGRFQIIIKKCKKTKKLQIKIYKNNQLNQK